MSTVAHLSDLHFGCHDPVAAAGLLDSLAAADIALVVVTGDLTQRARARQFQAARDFLARLPQPVLAVPGNHDIPLYDVLRRAFDPLGRYRCHVSPDTMPFYAGAGVCVLGLNSARAAAFVGGRISRAQAAAIRERLSDAPASAVRIVTFHHPLRPPPGAPHLPAVGRAAMAMEAMAAAGVRVALSGHYHRAYTGVIPMADGTSGPLLFVHAGTAISLRRRNEPNSYNLLDIRPDHVRCVTHMLDGARFRPARIAEYGWAGGGWVPL